MFNSYLTVSLTVSPTVLLQTKLAGEAQAKYERELMLHAADVEAMQELKKRSHQEAAQKRELEDQLNKMSSLLQEKTVAWNTLERQLKVGQLAQEKGDGKREGTRLLSQALCPLCFVQLSVNCSQKIYLQILSSTGIFLLKIFYCYQNSII